MGEELAERFFLKLFIAGLYEEIKSHVESLVPSTVYGARIYAKYSNIRKNQLAKHYQEAKSSMVSSSNIATACSKIVCEVEISKLTDEGGVEFVSTTSDNAENSRGAEEKETKMEHANCSIKVLGEVMEEFLHSCNEQYRLKLLSLFAQLTSVIPRGVKCIWAVRVDYNHISEMIVELKGVWKNLYSDRLDIVDEMEEDTE